MGAIKAPRAAVGKLIADVDKAAAQSSASVTDAADLQNAALKV